MAILSVPWRPPGLGLITVCLRVALIAAWTAVGHQQLLGQLQDSCLPALGMPWHALALLKIKKTEVLEEHSHIVVNS